MFKNIRFYVQGRQTRKDMLTLLFIHESIICQHGFHGHQWNLLIQAI